MGTLGRPMFEWKQSRATAGGGWWACPRADEPPKPVAAGLHAADRRLLTFAPGRPLTEKEEVTGPSPVRPASTARRTTSADPGRRPRDRGSHHEEADPDPARGRRCRDRQEEDRRGPLRAGTVGRGHRQRRAQLTFSSPVVEPR